MPREKRWVKVRERIAEIAADDGNHCSLCHRHLHDSDLSFGGLAADDTVALTGLCCLPSMLEIHTAGSVAQIKNFTREDALMPEKLH